ncbi:HU family DNA-binding protein [Neoehrlichia mikurensis]|uniref:HU family DNA-binding protein n=1 Tax=Neoehrlichia mikurensis TaxID=89586 RepID=A0A9Q9BV40_9RICK|nr:HU family DNA-binding protein [Neoehrlichia mikurensis]QXK91784.1 HU family DNA-binding protein [Neoehrlichia mikurensis]QXK92997.1 HU family DNA-binding protein [Neoehrlichia mikurensis]QXK93474.1 HU family DNA-binding protein [Neoehrlichia mikurensis]UTO55571.1 HU family DNA-binding protein [Neoehrlichia mikurensis]UTO56492.1 HU family DNA-binding protein [Neoehrlichia mikurensis]
MSLKSHLIQRISKKNPSLGEDIVLHIFDIFFSLIINNIKNNQRVELRGFGSFSTKSYIIKSSNSRLIKDKYKKIYFRPSNKLIQLINQQ